MLLLAYLAALSLQATTPDVATPDGASPPQEAVFQPSQWIAPAPAPSFHRSDEQLADASQVDLQIPEIVYTDEIDGVLWARTRDYKVRVTGDEFTYFPFLGSDAKQHWPVSWRLSSVRIGGEEVALTDGRALHSHEKFVQDLGDVDVVYDLFTDHVAQTVVVDLAGRSGAAVVEFELTTELATKLAGNALNFDGERGGVRVSRPFAVESSGRQRPIFVELEGSTLRMEVDAEIVSRSGSTLVIDPFISTFSVDTVISPQYEPDVSYCYATDTFTYVYTDGFTNGDLDIYVTRVDSSGGFVGGIYVDLTTEYWSKPKVASAQFHSQQLVVARRWISGPGQTFEVMGRVLTTASTSQTVGPPIVIGDATNWNNSDPDVGGSQRNAADAQFIVCWTREFNSGSLQARHRLVSSTGTLGPLQATFPSTNQQPGVKVSHSTGDPTAVNRWNVAVEEHGTTAPYSRAVVGLQFAPNGVRIAGALYRDSVAPLYNGQPTKSHMDVSDGIVKFGNSEPTYMIAWERRGLIGVFIRYDTLIDRRLLVRWSQGTQRHRRRDRQAQVSTTAERFIVTGSPWTRLVAQDRWAHVSVFDLTDRDKIVPSEAMVEYDRCNALFNDPDGFPFPLAVASRFSGGFQTSRYAHLGWSKYCPGVTTERDVSGALFTANSPPAIGITLPCFNSNNASRRAAMAVLWGNRTTTSYKTLAVSFLPPGGLALAFAGPSPAGATTNAYGVFLWPLCMDVSQSTGIPFVADSTGSATVNFDPTSLPYGLGGSSAMAGQTWGFQVVYPDTTTPGTPMRQSNVVYLDF
ncbi:hypothetical protein Poly30_07490 [Planctomycetes bacterium Poly30]|uniref:Uncharacterized protein n=1 Tax=Saltatorellus ferox TaxID=2528018 RepID=A0A518EME3_9BACT|nr:hypothetical protein Poly30_07490 [Planctomycetes bacterium Poly30]